MLQVVLRQLREPLAQVARRGEFGDAVRRADRQPTPPCSGGACGVSWKAACSASSRKVRSSGYRLWRGVAGSVGGRVVVGVELGEEARRGPRRRRPPRRCGRRRRASTPLASTSRIAFSSSVTPYLPISEATSPSAVCASFSRSSSRESTRRSPENSRVGRFEDQRRDQRRVLLPVAVDAAVALLDADEAPRDVVVDQLVALRVQVDALGGDVAGDQHADRARSPA